MKNFILLAAMLLTASTTVHSDEVTDTLDKARQYYDAKSYPEAARELNAALAGIQKMTSQQIIQCLPGAVEGWERSEPASTLGNEGAFGFVSANAYSVELTYSKKEPAQQVAITVSNVPHVVQIAKAGIQLLSNPFFAKMQQENQPQEKMENYKAGEFEGARTINAAQKRVETSLFYGDLMVQVRGSGMEDPAILEPFIQSVKFEELMKYSASKETIQTKP